MIYVNPFELLQSFADGESVFAMDEKRLRRVRKMIFAEADLSDGALRFKSGALSKNDISSCLDELDDVDKFENHKIIYQSRLLLNFLNDGNPEIFELADELDIYNSYTDFDLIAKPFAFRFDKLFVKAFLENDLQRIGRMNDVLAVIVDDEHQDACFESVDKHLRTLIDEYKTLIANLSKENINQKTLSSIFGKVEKSVNVKTVNALPDYFNLRRDEIASSIDKIGVTIHNEYDETEIACNLSRIAVSINTSLLVHKHIKENNETIEENNQVLQENIAEEERRKAEFDKQVKIIERIAKIPDRLEKIKKELDTSFILGLSKNGFGNRSQAYNLKNTIENMLEFNEINDLPEELDFAENLRDAIAMNLRAISILIHNNFDESEFALWLIEMALQIRVSSKVAEILLKSQNHLLNKKSKVSVSPSPETERVRANADAANPQQQNTREASQQNDANNLNRTNNQSEFFSSYQKLSEGYATPQKLITLITSLFVLSCLFILGYQFYFSSAKKTRVESGINFINDELWKINSTPILKVPAKSSETFVKRKFKNKLLLLDAKTSKINVDFHDKLSDENKPKSLDEVQTFVWIDCDDGKNIGSYTDGVSAYTMRCDLTAIDRAGITEIGRQYFITYPPNSVRRGQSRAGGIPYERIINYLKENTE